MIALAAACTAVGAAVGVGSGWLSVVLERMEKLRDEENEDFEIYSKEVEEEAEAARSAGDPPREAEPFERDRYGWTWIEWALNPLLTAATWGAFTLHDGPDRQLLIHLLWGVVFVHILGFDLKHRLILNRVTFPAVAVALLLSPLTPELGPVRAVVGALVTYLFFLVPNLLLGSAVIGRGDAKLGALIGAVTGLGGDLGHLSAVYAIIAGVVLGGVAAVVVLLVRAIAASTRARRLRDGARLFGRSIRHSLKEPIPYGPFLCAGAVLLLFNGP